VTLAWCVLGVHAALAQDVPRIERIAAESFEAELAALDSELDDLAASDVGLWVGTGIEGDGGTRLVAAWGDVVGRALAARVRAVAEIDGASAAEAAVESSRRGLDALVGVMLSVEGHALVATQTLYRSARGFAGMLSPRAELRAQASIRIRLDAYLRSFVEPLPLLTEERVRAVSGNLFGRSYLAIASTDVDRDGRDEIALLTTREVEILRVSISERGFVRPRRVATIPLVLRGAPSRSLRPVGTLAVREDGAIVGRTSEHATGFSIARAGDRWTVAESVECGENGFPLEDGCAQRVVGRDFYQAELTALPGREVPLAAVSGFYSRVHARVIAPTGESADMEVVVTPRGRLGSRADQLRNGIAGYGAALGLADLDQDGAPEVLTSDPSAPGEPDRLHLLRLRRDAALVAVWSSEPLAGAIWVAGSGDVDGDGIDELVAIEEPASGPSLMWIVR
jgi:hypothetical protein